MIIDECKYTSDSHIVDSTKLKEKYTYTHVLNLLITEGSEFQIWCTRLNQGYMQKI